MKENGTLGPVKNILSRVLKKNPFLNKYKQLLEVFPISFRITGLVKI